MLKYKLIYIYYLVKLRIALFLAFVSFFRSMPVFSRYRCALVHSRIMYARHRVDFKYSINCKILRIWAKQSKEAVVESDCRLRKNQELNTQFRINKEKLMNINANNYATNR